MLILVTQVNDHQTFLQNDKIVNKTAQVLNLPTTLCASNTTGKTCL